MLKIMKRINLKLAAVTILLLLLPVGFYAQEKKLNEAEAVRLAEQFIAQNGYTDLPPDKSKLAYESIEWESNIDEMLRQRRNTLEPKAYGVVRERKNAPGWTVVFRYKHRATGQMRGNGRAVTMNLDGSKMRVEHVDFTLKYVDKKP
jgi:hypothetical protein